MKRAFHNYSHRWECIDCRDAEQERTVSLDELRELSEKATPGEWGWNSYSVIFAVTDDDPEELPHVAFLPRRSRGDVATIQGEHDARLIVAAVNYVRAALAQRDREGTT